MQFFPVVLILLLGLAEFIFLNFFARGACPQGWGSVGPRTAWGGGGWAVRGTPHPEVGGVALAADPPPPSPGQQEARLHGGSTELWQRADLGAGPEVPAVQDGEVGVPAVERMHASTGEHAGSSQPLDASSSDIFRTRGIAPTPLWGGGSGTHFFGVNFGAKKIWRFAPKKKKERKREGKRKGKERQGCRVEFGRWSRPSGQPPTGPQRVAAADARAGQVLHRPPVGVVRRDALHCLQRLCRGSGSPLLGNP